MAPHLSAQSSQLPELLSFVSSSSLVCEKNCGLESHKFTLRWKWHKTFLCLFLNVRWEAAEYDKRAAPRRLTMRLHWSRLLNKDGLQAATSAGYVSRHSLPNYLHQLSLKPGLSTAAWGGAQPASEIRKDICDSWRHLELNISEANSVPGFNLHNGQEVLIAGLLKNFSRTEQASTWLINVAEKWIIMLIEYDLDHRPSRLTASFKNKSQKHLATASRILLAFLPTELILFFYSVVIHPNGHIVSSTACHDVILFYWYYIPPMPNLANDKSQKVGYGCCSRSKRHTNWRVLQVQHGGTYPILNITWMFQMKELTLKGHPHVPLVQPNIRNTPTQPAF